MNKVTLTPRALLVFQGFSLKDTLGRSYGGVTLDIHASESYMRQKSRRSSAEIEVEN